MIWWMLGLGFAAGVLIGMFIEWRFNKRHTIELKGRTLDFRRPR